MIISGIVVRTAPENFGAVLASLEASGLCEVHFSDSSAGKIVVTVEGDGHGGEMVKMRDILNTPGVLSAVLAYSCSDGE